MNDKNYYYGLLLTTGELKWFGRGKEAKSGRNWYQQTFNLTTAKRVRKKIVKDFMRA